MALGLALCLLLAAAPVNAAGKTKSLMLVTKCTEKYEGSSGTSVYKYGYNKNGLFAKESKKTKDAGSSYSIKYTYKGKNLKKSVVSYAKEKETTTYTTKNGLVVKSVTKSGKNTLKSTYTYKNKKLSKEVSKFKGGSLTNKFSYNKKGLVSKNTDTWVFGKEKVKYSHTFTYDKKGNPVKVKYSSGYSETIKNTYKKGRIVKKEITSKDSTGTTTVRTYEYTYSKVKVPASYAKDVKVQQAGLLRNTSPSTANY
jgi:hypothetical protein